MTLFQRLSVLAVLAMSLLVMSVGALSSTAIGPF
jgi:hypothetical protein